jgi:glutaredoxin
MTGQKYAIVTRGEIAAGQTLAQVRARVQELCKYGPESLDQVFSGVPFRLKSALDLATLTRYRRVLEATGLVCESIPMATSEAPPAPTAVLPEATFCCPKCGFTQQQEVSCPACGIVFDKYLAQQQKLQDEQRFYTPPPVAPASRTPHQSPGTGAGILRLVLLLAVLATAGYFGFSSFDKPGRDEILIYTAKDCLPCSEAKNYFAAKGVSYTEVNIDESAENMQKFERYGIETLPLAMIGGEQIVGFNPLPYGIAVAGFLGRKDKTLGTRILMYSTPGCPGCNQARKFFTEQDIAFEEYDIADPTRGAEYRSYNPFGTPLILVGGIRLDGFNQKAIEMALRQLDQL